jgi:TM2 domain-containing membrane protein YozV
MNQREPLSGARERDVQSEAIICTSCGSSLTPSRAVVCPVCSKASPRSAKISSVCGDDIGSGRRDASGFTSTAANQRSVKEETSRGMFIMLGVLLGLFGIHNFYAGYYGKGALQSLITVALGPIYIGIIITGIWVLIDLLTVRHDSDGNRMV